MITVNRTELLSAAAPVCIHALFSLDVFHVSQTTNGHTVRTGLGLAVPLPLTHQLNTHGINDQHLLPIDPPTCGLLCVATLQIGRAKQGNEDVGLAPVVCFF